MITPLNQNWTEEESKQAYIVIKNALDCPNGNEFIKILEDLCYCNKSTLPISKSGNFDTIGMARNEGMRIVVLWLKDRLNEIKNGVLNQ